MSKPMAKLFVGLASTALVWNSGASDCFAHPDHPVQIVSSSSALHYIVQPEHGLPLAVFAVAMWWISSTVKKHLTARVPAKKLIQVENSR